MLEAQWVSQHLLATCWVVDFLVSYLAYWHLENTKDGRAAAPVSLSLITGHVEEDTHFSGREARAGFLRRLQRHQLPERGFSIVSGGSFLSSPFGSAPDPAAGLCWLFSWSVPSPHPAFLCEAVYPSPVITAPLSLLSSSSSPPRPCAMRKEDALLFADAGGHAD